MIKKIFAVTLMSASLLAMGCSSDDDDDDGATTPVGGEEIDFGQGNNLIDALTADADNFSTLVGLLESAGLNDTLGNVANSFTILAPTNAAFEAMEAGALDALSADTAMLKNTLQYHVIPGNAALAAGAVTTAAGTELTIAASEPDADGVVVLSAGGSAEVVADPDATPPVEAVAAVPATAIAAEAVTAENGMIYALGAVLAAPPAPVVEEEPGEEEPGEEPGTGTGSGEMGAVQATIAGLGSFGQFMGQYDSGIGAQTLDDQAWTLFVPSDTAMNGATIDPQDYVVVDAGALDGDALLALVGGKVKVNSQKEFDVAGVAGALTVNGHAVAEIATGAAGAVIYSIEGLLE
ncbi:MAG: fasciclin domain-containing protein [Granulosicoccus sp.]